MNNNPPQIQYLQENLQSIRKIAKWTAEDLGKKIGVTKQTISNLENNRTRMNLTQYIAIRTVLEYEVKKNKENVLLPQVLNVIFDDENSQFSREAHENAKIKDKISMIGAAVAAGIAITSIVSMISPLSSTSSTLPKVPNWLKNILK